MADRKITSGTSHARIVYWHYKFQSFRFATSLRLQLPDSNVFAVDQGFIESEIASIDTQKSMRAAAGTFDITLLPSRNWRQVIAPGDWLAIYLYDEVEGKFDYKNKNIVMLGNVDRVARVKQKDEKTDKTIVRYHVSGRDFGKVFEDTDLFFNPYYALYKSPFILDTILKTRGLALKGSPSTLVSNLTDVFLSGNGAIVDDPMLGPAVTSTLNQWKIPDEMSQLFSGGGNSFHDILGKEIEDNLPGYKPRSTLTPGSNGGLWGTLQRNSNSIANHLYCDLERDGKSGRVTPSIYLKPIPVSPFFADLPGALDGSAKSLTEMAGEGVIEVSPTDIIFENIGRDGNYRFNMIWLEPKLSDKSAAVNKFSNAMNIAGIGLPMQCSESIQRYGLKKKEAVLEFTYQDTKKETSLNINIFKSFINLVYDLNAYHHCYETGTIEVSGKIDARLGRVLKIKNESDESEDQPSSISSRFDFASALSSLTPSKMYFIDGYKHSWRFPGKWTTEFAVTMGQWSNPATPFIDLDPLDFGLHDQQFDETSLVKTNVQRPGNDSPESKLSAITDALDFAKGLV